MISRFAAATVAIGALAANAAAAAPALTDPQPSAPASASKAAHDISVSPLVVPGGPPPTLAASYPKDGATIAAGVTVVALTFDQSMAKPTLPHGPWAAANDGGLTPDCLADPRLLADGKTFAILCSTEPGKAYSIDISAKSGLLSQANRANSPSALHFSTSETIIDNLSDALEAAGLSADDDPIMTSPQIAGPGAARTPLDSPHPHP